MYTNPEKLTAGSKIAVESTLTTLKTVFDSSERLAALNLNTARALFEDGSANVKTLLAAKTPEELFELQTAMIRPLSEKALAYYRTCYEIIAQGIEEVVKPYEVQFAEANKVIAVELEKAAASSPVGSDAAVAAVKSSIAAANSAFDQVSKVSRQVVELTETNISAATDAAVKAITTTPGSTAASRRKKTA